MPGPCQPLFLRLSRVRIVCCLKIIKDKSLNANLAAKGKCGSYFNAKVVFQLKREPRVQEKILSFMALEVIYRGS